MKVSAQGKLFKSIREVAEFYKIPYSTLLHRLDAGKTLDEAVLMGDATKKKITVAGKEFESIAQAARHFNLNQGTVNARLKCGWSPEEAVGYAPRLKKSKVEKTRNPVVVNGIKYKSLFAAARAFKLSPNMVNKRVKKGLTPEQALEVEPFPEWFVAGKGRHGVRQKQKRIERELQSGERKCSDCKQSKPLNMYNSSGTGGSSYRCKDCISAAFLRYRYRLSVSQFWSIYDEQNGCCGICKKELNLNKDTTWRPKTVAVDHCHATGVVRGILCAPCNQGLGLFKDSTQLLSSAISYLQASEKPSF